MCVFRTAAVCQPSINQLGVVTPPIHTWIAFSPSYFLFYDPFLGAPEVVLCFLTACMKKYTYIMCLLVCLFECFLFPFTAINSVPFPSLLLSFLWVSLSIFFHFCFFYSFVLFFLWTFVFRSIKINFCACKCRCLNCCVFLEHDFVLRRMDLQLTGYWKWVLWIMYVPRRVNWFGSYDIIDHVN